MKSRQFIGTKSLGQQMRRTGRYGRPLLILTLAIGFILYLSLRHGDVGPVEWASSGANAQEIETVSVEHLVQAPTPTAANQQQGFPVILDGKTLFFIKVGGRTTTARQRARLATDQINDFAKNFAISIDALKVEDL